MKTPGKQVQSDKKSDVLKKENPNNDSFNEFDDELDLGNYEDLDDLDNFDLDDEDDY